MAYPGTRTSPSWTYTTASVGTPVTRTTRLSPGCAGSPKTTGFRTVATAEVPGNRTAPRPLPEPSMVKMPGLAASIVAAIGLALPDLLSSRTWIGVPGASDGQRKSTRVPEAYSTGTGSPLRVTAVPPSSVVSPAGSDQAGFSRTSQDPARLAIAPGLQASFGDWLAPFTSAVTTGPGSFPIWDWSAMRLNLPPNGSKYGTEGKPSVLPGFGICLPGITCTGLLDGKMITISWAVSAPKATCRTADCCLEFGLV